ncbi:hypothetical protein B0T10DRAFT_209939 [Thelonectria olida]|uniref:Tetraspanin n=1 Tax=Thelonectria olida TaxID=1576542 RepID=A0A9P9AU08_9HYPO|nr:hypothetical protein B0T10DRAFT_209939 [Thelonectria olida]
MAKWWLIYLLFALLFGVAIYEHVNSTTLSLPISRPLTIIALLLPLFGAVNLRFFRSSGSSTSRRVLAIGLQALQAILVTVLATLFFSDVLPSAARTCLLSTTWQHLFSSHDADSIRRIQDAFNCCGFNTVRDRAWPFPSQHGSRDCIETYGRNVACVGPWQMALQRNSGLEFGIALAVGLLQIVGVFLVATNSHSDGIYTRRPIQRHAVNESERARLLPGIGGGSYDGERSPHDVEQNGQTDTTNDPSRRIEPSHNNPWNSG